MKLSKFLIKGFRGDRTINIEMNEAGGGCVYHALHHEVVLIDSHKRQDGYFGPFRSDLFHDTLLKIVVFKTEIIVVDRHGMKRRAVRGMGGRCLCLAVICDAGGHASHVAVNLVRANCSRNGRMRTVELEGFAWPSAEPPGQASRAVAR